MAERRKVADFSWFSMQKKYKHSLMTQSVIWIIIPQFLVMIAIALVIFFVNQRIVVSLLVDRDRQLAMISASRISQAVTDYAYKLQFVAEEYAQITRSGTEDEHLLDPTIKALGLTDSYIAIIDSTGIVLDVRPAVGASAITNLVNESYLVEVLHQKQPYFSDLLLEQESGHGMIIISIPVYLPTGEASGVILGGLYFTNSSIGELIKGLKVGDEGFAYLVDRTGHVIYHPDQDNIGMDFSDRFFVSKVMSGVSGGGVETTPTGERLVVGYAPIEDIGWGLVVREPWEEVIEPVRIYGGIIFLIILFITGVTTRFLWLRMRRITTPIRQLEEQAARLGSGGAIEPVFDSGISEIDSLASAFMHMADQVVSYRARLQRHLRAITQSQDEERRRVARELHDETIQNMLAVDRQLELFLSRGDGLKQNVSVSQIHEMVQETIRGVRQIVRNLRPLVLEDLGLIPAIKSMLSTLDEEEPNLNTHLEISGDTKKLSPDLELALYRIIHEALTNCRRHAEASTVVVDLMYTDGEVRLQIQDNGRGFIPPRSIAEFADLGHFGMMGIQERVAALGGEFHINSAPDRGTSLTVVFPLNGLIL